MKLVVDVGQVVFDQFFPLGVEHAEQVVQLDSVDVVVDGVQFDYLGVQ